jgi:stage II sporulation SpoM-like protein
MSANEYVFAAGMRATRATLADWQARPWPLWGRIAAGSLAIAVTLLSGVWLFAATTTVDTTPVSVHGLDTPATFSSYLEILARNSLVLAFHAFACVAGFIAGSSIPMGAEGRGRFSRWFHEKAAQFAIVFVCGVTIFSLCTQVYFLGGIGATIAWENAISPGVLVLTILPHALMELTAVFLPLAAWLYFSRRGEWDRLLAATFVTVAVAVPMLLTAAAIETLLWPKLLEAASPLA